MVPVGLHLQILQGLRHHTVIIHVLQSDGNGRVNTVELRGLPVNPLPVGVGAEISRAVRNHDVHVCGVARSGQTFRVAGLRVNLHEMHQEHELQMRQHLDVLWGQINYVGES